MTNEHQQEYAAFISYARGDAAFASWLHHKLETYRAPRTGQRVGRVFLDRAELSASPDLADTLKRSLEASNKLIVVCSRNAARSPWVDREVEHFQELRGSADIIGVYVDGAPFSRDQEDANLPASWRVSADAPPLLVNATKGNRSEAALRIIAALLAVPFDALRQRERVRENRRRLALAGVFVAAAATFAMLLGASSEFTRRRQALAEFYRTSDFAAARSLVSASAPPSAVLANSTSFATALSDPAVRLLLSVAASVRTTNPMSLIEYVSPNGDFLIAGDADRGGTAARLYRLPFDARTMAEGLPGEFAFASANGFTVFARDDEGCSGRLTEYALDGRTVVRELRLQAPPDWIVADGVNAGRARPPTQPWECGRLRRYYPSTGTYLFEYNDRATWALTVAQGSPRAVSVSAVFRGAWLGAPQNADERFSGPLMVRCHAIASSPVLLCFTLQENGNARPSGAIAARVISLVDGSARDIPLPSGARVFDFSTALANGSETYFGPELSAGMHAIGVGANEFSTLGASEWEIFAARTRRLLALQTLPCVRLNEATSFEPCVIPNDVRISNWFSLGRNRFMTFAPGGRVVIGTREEIATSIAEQPFSSPIGTHTGARSFVEERLDAVQIGFRWLADGDLLFDLSVLDGPQSQAIAAFCRPFINDVQIASAELRYPDEARLNEGCPCERRSLIGRSQATERRCLR